VGLPCSIRYEIGSVLLDMWILTSTGPFHEPPHSLSLTANMLRLSDTAWEAWEKARPSGERQIASLTVFLVSIAIHNLPKQAVFTRCSFFIFDRPVNPGVLIYILYLEATSFDRFAGRFKDLVPDI
jgi:hypothetical protein